MAPWVGLGNAVAPTHKRLLLWDVLAGAADLLVEPLITRGVLAVVLNERGQLRFN